MCQLFALNGNSPAAVTFAFTGFSARGGSTGDHADGFGLAFHSGTSCRLFIDEGRASDAKLADFLRSHPIRAHTALAHIRKATQGPALLENCHPFVREWRGRYWSFCHNGDLVDFHPKFDGPYQPVGATDSERAFCWLLQELQRRLPSDSSPDWHQIAPLLAELARSIESHGIFNFLLSDGRALYAYGSTRLYWLKRDHPFGTAHLVDHDLTFDLSTVNGAGDQMILIATEPLTRDESWTAFSAGELRVFAEGDQVWQDTRASTLDPAPVSVPDPVVVRALAVA